MELGKEVEVDMTGERGGIDGSYYHDRLYEILN